MVGSNDGVTWFLEDTENVRGSYAYSPGSTIFASNPTFVPYLYHRLIISQVGIFADAGLAQGFVGRWEINGLFYDQTGLLSLNNGTGNTISICRSIHEKNTLAIYHKTAGNLVTYQQLAPLLSTGQVYTATINTVYSDVAVNFFASVSNSGTKVAADVSWNVGANHNMTTYTNYWVGKSEDASINRIFNLNAYSFSVSTNTLSVADASSYLNAVTFTSAVTADTLYGNMRAVGTSTSFYVVGQNNKYYYTTNGGTTFSGRTHTTTSAASQERRAFYNAAVPNVYIVWSPSVETDCAVIRDYSTAAITSATTPSYSFSSSIQLTAPISIYDTQYAFVAGYVGTTYALWQFDYSNNSLASIYTNAETETFAGSKQIRAFYAFDLSNIILLLKIILIQ